MYLLGYHGDRVFYLDPHRVQRAASPSFIDKDRNQFSWDNPDGIYAASAEALTELKNSYFCPEINSILMETINPCMSIGFYCHDDSDLEIFCNFISDVISASSILLKC